MIRLKASWFTDSSGSRAFFTFSSSSCTCFSNCSCALKKLPRCPLKSATTSLACPYASTNSIPCALYSWYISQPLRIAAAAVFATARMVSGSILHSYCAGCGGCCICCCSICLRRCSNIPLIGSFGNIAGYINGISAYDVPPFGAVAGNLD